MCVQLLDAAFATVKRIRLIPFFNAQCQLCPFKKSGQLHYKKKEMRNSVQKSVLYNLWFCGFLGSKTRERQLKMYLVGRYCSTKKVAIRVRNTLYSVWKLIIVWCHCHLAELAERGQITQKYTLQRSNSAGLWETPPAPNLSDNFHAFFILFYLHIFLSHGLLNFSNMVSKLSLGIDNVPIEWLKWGGWMTPLRACCIEIRWANTSNDCW